MMAGCAALPGSSSTSVERPADAASNESPVRCSSVRVRVGAVGRHLLGPARSGFGGLVVAAGPAAPGQGEPRGEQEGRRQPSQPWRGVVPGVVDRTVHGVRTWAGSDRFPTLSR